MIIFSRQRKRKYQKRFFDIHSQNCHQFGIEDNSIQSNELIFINICSEQYHQLNQWPIYLLKKLIIHSHIAILRMKQTKFVAINTASLLFTLTIVISFSLSWLVLLLAFAIMIVNIWNITKSYLCIKQQRDAKLHKGKNQLNIFEFQNKVRQAYDKSLARQAEEYRAKDYYWSKNYLRQSDQIAQLRKTPLAQQYKNSSSRREMFSHRDQGSSAKRVRAFFANKKEDTIIPQEVKKEIRQIADAYFSKEVFKNHRKNNKFDDYQILNCIKIINQFINTKIQVQIDEIIEDFQAVDKFLNRCFSANLTLQLPISQQFVTYNQLLQLAHIIEKKRIIPGKFKTSLSVLQICQKLSEVRKNINRLPCFSLSPNVLKLALALKYLRKDFSEENIIFADFIREQKARQGQKHIIRLQDDDRFFYHKYPQIKTKQTSIIMLLILISIFQKYYKSGKHLIKQLSMELGLKSY